MWKGIIDSRFTIHENPYHVHTVCHPDKDMIAARISTQQPAGIRFHFSYPTGGHSDDACNWDANDRHSTSLVVSTHRFKSLLITASNATASNVSCNASA